MLLEYYRPPLAPPKNPIKREKKKLAYSSEREDFIESGEDQFACLLRVLGMSSGCLARPCQSLVTPCQRFVTPCQNLVTPCQSAFQQEVKLPLPL